MINNFQVLPFGPSFARTINELVNDIAARSNENDADINCYKNETDNAVSFIFDVPGVQKNDITLGFDNNGTVLTVSATRTIGDNSMKMSTKVSVPKKVDTTGDVKCSLKDGVLTVTIPVKKESQPRKLTID